jgi:hypothetical protein
MAIADLLKYLGIKRAVIIYRKAVPEVIRRLSAALGQPGPDAAIIFITLEDDGTLAVQAADEDACYTALNTRSTTPAGEIT